MDCEAVTGTADPRLASALTWPFSSLGTYIMVNSSKEDWSSLDMGEVGCHPGFSSLIGPLELVENQLGVRAYI